MRILLLLWMFVVVVTAVALRDEVHNDYPPSYDEKHFVAANRYDGPSKAPYKKDDYGGMDYGKRDYGDKDNGKNDYGDGGKEYPSYGVEFKNDYKKDDGYDKGPADKDKYLYGKGSLEDSYGKDSYTKASYDSNDKGYPGNSYDKGGYEMDNYVKEKDYVDNSYGKGSKESYEDMSYGNDNKGLNNKDPYPTEPYGKEPYMREPYRRDPYLREQYSKQPDNKNYPGNAQRYQRGYPPPPGPIYQYPTYAPVFGGYPYNYIGFPYNYHHAFPYSGFNYPRTPYADYYHKNQYTEGNERKYSCKKDGYFYHKSNSFYHCHGDDYTVQYCAAGSLNHPASYYTRQPQDYTFDMKDFCSVNMATFGYPAPGPYLPQAPAPGPYLPRAPAPVYPPSAPTYAPSAPTYAPPAPVYPPPATDYAAQDKKEKH